MIVLRNNRFALASIAVVTMFAMTPIALTQLSKDSATVQKTGQLHTSATPTVRVVKTVDNAKRVKLAGHVSSALRQATDLGHLAKTTPAQHMVMVLSSSDEQKAELHRVLDQQQDKNSANYHQWVTPDQFGAHFGASDADISQVSSWLKSQGFTVEDVSKSKRVLHFSGTTGNLEQAFGTEMHTFKVGDETHVANNSDISVPEALKPVISGVTLNNFFRKSHALNRRSIPASEISKPDYTSGTTHYTGAWDFATMYNTFPLLNAGITGKGSSIAVVGRSDILLSDVQNYRQLFYLPNNDPIFIHAGQDNGVQPGDDGESDLDVEISGGIAPNAQLYFVIGTPTFLVDGITNSVEYIVENNLADIMSISYGSCESVEGVGGNEFNNQAFEQAAAQGISIFVASGDNGPAECDADNSTYEVYGYSTGGESSTPYSVSVGGAQFYESGASPYPLYWSTTTQVSAPYYGLSAITYSPEVPWNESKAADKSLSTGSSLSGIVSGSGGISSYYIQPPWQRGSGVPTTDPAYTQGGDWVNAITITSGGSGYSTVPAVTATGGGCTAEPTLIATLSGGAVSSVAFQYFTATGTEKTGQGFGCTSVPTIAIAAPTSGTTATATATISPMVNTPPLVSGVPHRYTPDLVLNASSGHDGTIFCSEGECANGYIGLVGGTSVAAPSMAGIQALINQANGGRQGMPGYIYYALSNAQTEANCNSSTPPAAGSNCAFHDITLGDNYICGLATCTAVAQKMGWPAAVGYDLASGLGSPNAYNLSTQWKNVVFNSTTSTLGLSQTTGIAQGAPITISGTVAASAGAGTPTGDVAFILSNGFIGQTVDVSGDANNGAFNGPTAFATLNNGSYSATLSSLPAGSYTLTARYGGDGTYASSLSTPVPVSVNPGNSVMSITPQVLNLSTCIINNGATYAYGAPAYITINVASSAGAGVPTGTINITVDGAAYATVPLDPNGNGYVIAGNYGTAATSCLYDYLFSQGPLLPVGSHTISASYSGDGTFSAINAASAPTVPITVSQAPTTVTLSSGAQTITSGFSVPLVATISAITSGQAINASAPTGTVTFTDTTTSTVLGTATVTPTTTETDYVTSTTGYPTYTYGAVVNMATTGITTSGANAITATYNGDGNYTAVTSTAGTVTVDAAAPAGTTTVVTSSANPIALAGRPTFTATIGLTAAGTAPTTGTVTFYDGSTLLGTATVGSAHTAALKLATATPFVAGVHSVTAIYGGIAADGPSTSAPLSQTVSKGTGTFYVGDPKGAGLSGQAFALAVVLTPSPTGSGIYPLTGSVQFYDGATLIGSSVPVGISEGQGGYGNWTTTFALTLAPGAHSITAQYSDNNYTFTPSTAVTITVITAVPSRIWTVNGNATSTSFGTTGTMATMGTSLGTSTLGGVAMDSAGDAWWTASANNSLYFATTVSANPAIYTGGGLSTPVAVAVDGSGYVWVANSNAGTVSEFSHAGAAVTTSPAIGGTANGAGASEGANSIAIDNTGGVWVTNPAGNAVTHIIGAAAPVTTSLTKAVTNGTVGAKP